MIFRKGSNIAVQFDQKTNVGIAQVGDYSPKSMLIIYESEKEIKEISDADITLCFSDPEVVDGFIKVLQEIKKNLYEWYDNMEYDLKFREGFRNDQKRAMEKMDKAFKNMKNRKEN